MQEDIGSLLRSLIREEIRNMSPPQGPPPGAPPGMDQGTAPAAAPPGPQATPRQGGPAAAGQVAPATAGPGGGTPAAWGQAGYDAQAMSPAQVLARAHMELTESMRQNLQRLQTVLRETEILAQQMEQFLAHQSRQPWQRQDTPQGDPRPGQAGRAGRQAAARRRLWRSSG